MKHRHILHVIGWTGVSRAYLDMPRSEAIARFLEEEGQEIFDDSLGDVSSFGFENSFFTYSASGLPENVLSPLEAEEVANQIVELEWLRRERARLLHALVETAIPLEAMRTTGSFELQSNEVKTALEEALARIRRLVCEIGSNGEPKNSPLSET